MEHEDLLYYWRSNMNAEEMKSLPMNSTDQSKIMIFILLLLVPIGFGVGVLPAIFLLFGLFMMRRNNDFSHIEVAVKYYRYYLYLIIVGWIVSYPFGLWSSKWANDRIDWTLMTLGFIAISIAYLFFEKYLFYRPLSAHSEWVVVNGIFTNKNKAKNNKHRPDLTKGQQKSSHSVADELIKWAKLKEDGHITQDQYEMAKTKILDGQ